jgi:hypothetical protein
MGIFLRDEDGAYSLVAETNMPVGTTRLTSVDNPDLNNNGEIVFEARLATGMLAIVHWDLATDTGQIVAQTGNSIGGRTLRRLYHPTIDDDGVVYFDDGTEIFEVDLSDGSSQVYVARNTTIDGTVLVQAKRPDVDSAGSVVFTGIGVGATNTLETAVYTTEARLVGPGDTPDSILLTTADWAGIAEDAGPFFIGTYPVSTATASGLFALTEALVLPEDEVAGEEIVAVRSVRPNAVGQFVFHASVIGGSAVFLRTTVTNEDPVADAGKDQIVEATSPAGAAVTLDGTGSADPDGDTMTYSWTTPTAGSSTDTPLTGATPRVTLPLGKTVLMLTVDDGNGGTATDEVVVTVVDTEAPSLDLSVDRRKLWPPDRRMVSVAIRLEATDVAAASADLTVECRVSSSEPDVRCVPRWLARLFKIPRFAGDVNGEDGYTAPVSATLTWDEGEEAWTGSVSLRAERNHPLRVRSYTIEAAVADAGGNDASAHAKVKVAFDRKTMKKKRCRR